MRALSYLALALPTTALAFAPAPVTHAKTTNLQMAAQSNGATTRKVFVNSLIAGVLATSSGALPSFAEEEVKTLPNGVTYKIIKSGSGDLPKPAVGELIAIRFRAFAGAIKIDDIFDTREPYYTRLGSGGLLSGVEQTLPLMQVGDRWELTIPVRLLILT